MEIEDRDLVGIEYPGRVVNVDNMVKTLGGLTNISKIVSVTSCQQIWFSSKMNIVCVWIYCDILKLQHLNLKVCNMDNKKRLDLKFRPDDVFSKPIYGDLKPASGLLLKVVFRRRRHDVPGPSTENNDADDEPKIQVLGVVRSMFKFDGK